MMQISTPNAAYKIGSLVRKGYVEKIQSTTDRREYHLRPTQKYIDYYSISYSYLHTVIERVRERFSPEDVNKLEEMLTVINNELMPELQLPPARPPPTRRTLPPAMPNRRAEAYPFANPTQNSTAAPAAFRQWGRFVFCGGPPLFFFT